jgi:hypothetical protein
VDKDQEGLKDLRVMQHKVLQVLQVTQHQDLQVLRDQQDLVEIKDL